MAALHFIRDEKIFLRLHATVQTRFSPPRLDLAESEACLISEHMRVTKRQAKGSSLSSAPAVWDLAKRPMFVLVSANARMSRIACTSLLAQ